jgi:hypothetical protein
VPGATKPLPTATYGQYNAYDSNYKAVLPFSESGGTAFDRTGVNNLAHSNVTTGVSSPLGKGVSYNGSSSISQKASPVGLGITRYTYTVLAKGDSAPSTSLSGQVVNKHSGSSDSNYVFSWHHGAATFSQSNAQKDTNGSWHPAKITSTILANTWYQIGGCFDGSSICAIFNGQQQGVVSTSVNPVSGSGNIVVGTGGTSFWGGDLSELRISSLQRSAAWIKADYDNQFQTSGFADYTLIQDAGDQITADSIITGTPALDTATIGQLHKLTADNILTGSPVLDTASILSVSNIDTVTGDSIVTGVPVLTLAQIGQLHKINADDILTGQPELDTASIIGVENIDSVTGDSIVTGLPTLSQAEIGQLHKITADNILTGQPVLSTASIIGVSNVDTVTGDSISTGVPTLSQAEIGQVHKIQGQSIVTGVPVLDTATITDVSNVDFVQGNPILTGQPILLSANIGQVHKIQGQSITTGIPVLSTASITDSAASDFVTGDNILTGVPVIGQAEIGQLYKITANDILTGQPELSTATLAGLLGFISLGTQLVNNINFGDNRVCKVSYQGQIIWECPIIMLGLQSELQNELQS